MFYALRCQSSDRNSMLSQIPKEMVIVQLIQRYNDIDDLLQASLKPFMLVDSILEICTKIIFPFTMLSWCVRVFVSSIFVQVRVTWHTFFLQSKSYLKNVRTHRSIKMLELQTQNSSLKDCSAVKQPTVELNDAMQRQVKMLKD